MEPMGHTASFWEPNRNAAYVQEFILFSKEQVKSKQNDVTLLSSMSLTRVPQSIVEGFCLYHRISSERPAATYLSLLFHCLWSTRRHSTPVRVNTAYQEVQELITKCDRLQQIENRSSRVVNPGRTQVAWAGNSSDSGCVLMDYFHLACVLTFIL